MPVITVAAVIPLFNGAAFIREALESVFAQSEPPDEIIVVDDGSTDNGAAVVEELAKTRPVVLLRKANGGQSSARNLAIQNCQSSHIALLDQDDAWYPEHLAILKRPLERASPTDRLALVYGNLDHVDVTGQMVAHGCLDIFSTKHPRTTLEQCIGQDMFILPGASLIDRKVILEAGCFDEQLSGYEDDDLFLRIFRGGYRSTYIDQPVTRWRIHSSSTSYSMKMAVSRMIYYRKLKGMFPNEPRLHTHWLRDLIAPRFFRSTIQDFIGGSRLGDVPRMERTWADIQEIASELPRRPRKRIRRVAPLINLTYRGRFTNIARHLLRYAASCRK
ncbi:glycosyltransferase involved in cell wall biosynthesis [Aminobacter aminovorans]|uniref:Hyaluronan synthase n=1 Tax=Aminobacter aminovorans TaxID=83263 RepID=A0A381IPF5_AMIAI|nr:glycosyltransferase family A protein [Aminobacter aminovorans]TCS24651.1 glycosyltransferase involved in cell wall biosynthesis [Aminobacter aminovorans]SUY29274.1 Hyaluronan synthase [Aminobacter aminovorans]